MARKETIWEINLLRAFAILAVLLIHNTSMPLNRLDHDSSMYGVYLLLNSFSGFAVPVFLFISGIVLLYTYHDKPCTPKAIGEFYRKRTASVLLPYLFFSVIYFILNNYNVPEYLHSPKRFAYLLLTGRAHTHLYFMFIILQFYALFPLFWAAARRLGAWFPVPFFALQIGYMFLNREVIVHLTHIPAIFHRTGSLSISYFAFFALGGLIGMRYSAIRAYLRPRRGIGWKALPALLAVIGWLVSGSVTVYAAYLGSVAGKGYSPLTMYWIWFAHMLLSSLALLVLASLAAERLPARAVRVLMNLGGCAFGIYLIHPLIQWFYRLLPLSNEPLAFHAFFLGMFAASFVISWAMTAFAARATKWSWVFLGAAPRPVSEAFWAEREAGRRGRTATPQGRTLEG